MEVLDLQEGDLFFLISGGQYVYEVVSFDESSNARIKEVAMKINNTWKIKSACDIINCNGYSRCQKVRLEFNW